MGWLITHRNVPLFYATWLLRPAAPLECCRVVKEAGFDGASFLVGTVDDPRRLDWLSERQAAGLREGFIEMDLDRSLHVSTSDYLGDFEGDQEGLALLKEHVAAGVAAVCGPGLPPLNVTLDPPLRWDAGEPWLPPETVEELTAFLISLRDGYDIRPGLENWPFLPVGTPEGLAAALLGTGDQVGILLDTGHAHIALSRGWCQQPDARAFVEALPAPIVEVHLHDNRGMDDEHLMPGEGTADLHGLLEAAFATGFRGPITIECDLEAKGRPGLAAALAQIREK